MISLQDHVGSGYAIAEAISLNTNHFVEYMVLLDDISGHNTHKYPYLYKKKTDIGAEPNSWEVPETVLGYAQGMIDSADIIHFKGDEIPIDGKFYGLKIPDKKSIITVGGSFFRRGNTITSMPKHEISEYVEMFDVRTAITPDLNYPEFKGNWMPHAYDCMSINNTWKNNKIPIIAHSPGLENKKGTEEFNEACRILKDEGIKFDIDIIEDESRANALERVSHATIFFAEMSGCGWYGMSGVEAMSMGIPTVAYLSDEAIRQGNCGDTAVINCGKTIDTIVDTLKILLTDYDLKTLSKKSHQYAKDTYSYEVMGKTWRGIYEDL